MALNKINYDTFFLHNHSDFSTLMRTLLSFSNVLNLFIIALSVSEPSLLNLAIAHIYLNKLLR